MKLRRLILQKIGELGEATLDGFFPAKYPEARLWRGLLGANSSYKFSRPTFSAILSQLRREGFVEKVSSGQKVIWRITREGLVRIQEREKPNGAKSDGVMRIVSFDIPERERKKRRWLREELLDLGYQQLQKSVWVGFAPLRENFFGDLDLLSLRDNIHIFSVAKKGTLDERTK